MRLRRYSSIRNNIKEN